MTAPKALKAFYGARADDAHTRTVKAHIAPGERPQEIFTPSAILAPLYRAWGGIALDPCGHPDAPVQADVVWTGERCDTGRKGKNGPIMAWRGPGCERPWVDRTFYNPPYCDLEQWLTWAAQQVGRVCGLYPARTHRKWWRAHHHAHVDGILWLNPVTFEAYDQANPDRLVLTYRGPDLAVLIRETPPELGDWTGPMRAP